MTDRKKPGVAFWGAVVVAVVVLYAASVGPAYWAACSGWLPVDAYRWIYAPILGLYRNGPRPVHDIIRSYCHWWFGQ